MLKTFKKAGLEKLNGALSLLGWQLIRISAKKHDWGDVAQFIPMKETLAGARAAGLSLGEYIDIEHNVPGATQATHDRLVELGVFKGRIDRVCEIGPGSGRFLEKTIQACQPCHYEVYETARPWADWLVSTYHVIAQPTNGVTLANTPANSIDLFQAHKVFVVLLFLNVCNYFTEIARVTRPGAWVVFDVMTEDCMDKDNMAMWLKTGINTRTYPAILPKRFVTDFFEAHGFALIASFLVPMKPGRTECMVFKKQSP
jgi:hypothetical protein